MKTNLLKFISLWLIIIGSLSSCHEKEAEEEFPEEETCNFDNPLADLPWLKEIVDEFEKEANALCYNPHARIYQCAYKDGIGFLIEMCVGCLDAGYSFRNCEGVVLCENSGLSGEDNCSELNIDFENRKLVWEINERLSLKDTQWKLAGTVEAHTGKLTEFKPADCNFCYTLVFDTDSTAYGYSAGNKIALYLKPLLIMKPETLAGETGDGDLFLETVKALQSYKRTGNELRFYFNENRDYLLFEMLSKLNDLGECKWININPVSVDSNLEKNLKMFFSGENSCIYWRNMEGDSLLFIINSREELQAITPAFSPPVEGIDFQSIDIDFENHCIIWGRLGPVTMGSIVSSKQLFRYYPSSHYIYEVSVKICVTDCYTAFARLYFWDIYPQNIDINDVSVSFNITELD